MDGGNLEKEMNGLPPDFFGMANTLGHDLSKVRPRAMTSTHHRGTPCLTAVISSAKMVVGADLGPSNRAGLSPRGPEISRDFLGTTSMSAAGRA